VNWAPGFQTLTKSSEMVLMSYLPASGPATVKTMLSTTTRPATTLW